jgi:hypothetical protein
MNPTEKLLDTFYFITPVLGFDSIRPDNSYSKTEGVTLEFVMDDEVFVRVLVPWSNIACEVLEQHWFRPGQTAEEFYEERRQAEEERRQRRYELEMKYAHSNW